MALKVHLLTQNNEKTISKALESLSLLNAEIIVGDMGSKDGTHGICLKNNVKVIHLNNVSDRSKLRNELLGPDMNFYLEPWEILTSGHDNIRSAGNGNYQIQVYRDNIITRETRLWKGSLFENPVYETLKCANLQPLDAAIYSVGANQLDINKTLEVTRSWRESTRKIDPYYYEAITLLIARKFDEFVTISEHYLSLDETSMSATMLRYYLAQILLFNFEDASKSVRHILMCLAIKPTMAEFWCVLGDIYYKLKKYKKSKSFYENAMILGMRRKNDDWPIDLDKYKNHPERMISNIDEVLTNKLFGQSVN